MSPGHMQRYLRAEELYKELIALYPEAVIRAVGGETVIRGKLDAIYALGKIGGRMSAAEQNVFIFADNDRMIEGWQRIVDSVTTDASPVVAYAVGSLWLCLACGPGKPTAITVRRDALMSGETYLCDDCGNRIVDSA